VLAQTVKFREFPAHTFDQLVVAARYEEDLDLLVLLLRILQSSIGTSFMIP